PRRKSCGRNSSCAYQVLIQLWKLVPQRTRSGPLSRGGKPARAVPGSASTLRITSTASSGSKVSACSTQMIGAVAPLRAAVDRRSPATGLVPDDKQPGRLRDGDGGVGAAAIHR